MPHVLDPVRELVGAAQRRSDDFARRARRLHADVPIRARADEQAHLDAVLASERDHPADFPVGLEHDAAALADPMDRDTVLARRGDNRLHRPRPFARRNLDPILSAVGKSLRGGRQVVRIPRGKIQAAERVCRWTHVIFRLQTSDFRFPTSDFRLPTFKR